jgi:hypothetical protein
MTAPLTEDSPDLPEFEDFQVDDGPLHRYRRTGDVDGQGYTIYRFEASATEQPLTA